MKVLVSSLVLPHLARIPARKPALRSRDERQLSELNQWLGWLFLAHPDGGKSTVCQDQVLMVCSLRICKGLEGTAKAPFAGAQQPLQMPTTPGRGTPTVDRGFCMPPAYSRENQKPALSPGLLSLLHSSCSLGQRPAGLCFPNCLHPKPCAGWPPERVPTCCRTSKIKILPGK